MAMDWDEKRPQYGSWIESAGIDRPPEPPRPRPLPGRVPPPPESLSDVFRYYRVNVILFLLTIASTLLAGGPWYSFTIMSILLAHEMGHYLASRHYRVPATLPYFLPVPFPPLGTLGAVILMRGRMRNRKALFDIAVAGPLAGLILALPATMLGLKMSEVTPSNGQPGLITLGDSLLFSFLSDHVLGPLPEGQDILLHPMAFAGWVGLFVTSLNLLPVLQLDGGHIAYAILGRKSQWVTYGALIAFVYIWYFHFRGWVLMVALLLFFGFLVRFRHPPPLDDLTPLDAKRRYLGWAMLVFFLLSFTPAPFKF
jgi:membrane-associated protease RseP (regulator of RpoE activity)